MTFRSTIERLPFVGKIISSSRRDIASAISGELAWRGSFANWTEAVECSAGYEQGNILETVKQSMLKIKSGHAVYERDGVLFDKIQYSWPLLSYLLKAALENKARLSVVDFGGSLGSSYFQNKDMLGLNENLRWSVIEQKHFVDAGKAHFEDESLRFYYDVETCLEKEQQDVLLLSGVLAYLERPYDQAGYFNRLAFDYIIIDRNAFINAEMNLLTSQVVSESVSYPTWFLNKDQLLGKFTNYELVVEFDDNTTQPVVINGSECYWGGLILKKLC